MADEETTLTAGMAYLFALACSSRSMSALPVTTPGFTVAGLRGRARAVRRARAG